jgi:inner membrane protein
MALAVTHVLVAILLLDVFRHYVFGLKKFPRHLLVVGGIAGLMPDIDIPLGWFLSFVTGNTINIHGSFTHSLFIVFVFILMAVISQYQGEIKRSKWLYVIATGWFIHILLDCGFNAYATFLWPLPIDTLTFCPERFLGPKYGAAIDAIILVVWLVHEEVHKKIKDYF